MNLQQHLATIRAFYRSHRRMPSYSELTAVVGYRSKNAAYKLAARLIDGGWLEKDEAGKIVPGRLFHAVPVNRIWHNGWDNQNPAGSCAVILSSGTGNRACGNVIEDHNGCGVQVYGYSTSQAQVVQN